MDRTHAEKEIKYRLSKWLVRNLTEQHLISRKEACECIKQLLDLYDPPMRCFEDEPNETNNKD